MNRYAVFGIVVAILLAAGGGTFLAYDHFLGSPSGHSKEVQKASNSPQNSSSKVSEKPLSNYTLVVMGWTTSNGPDPGANAFGDVSSLIVMKLKNGTGGIIYRPINVSALTQQQLKSMGIIITPAFGWAYAGNFYVVNSSRGESSAPSRPLNNPPITHLYFYNKEYQKVEVFFPECLKVTPGKPFGIIILNFNYKTGKEYPPPLENISFKFSFKEISKQECKVWVSIYANGTYIGKVPVILKIVPPGALHRKVKNGEGNYEAVLIKACSWEAYDSGINAVEVHDSLLIVALCNGSVNPSNISYNLQEMGISPSLTEGWVYSGVFSNSPNVPKFAEKAFFNPTYQKVVVYYPEKLKVSPGNPFGVILRYSHVKTEKKAPPVLEKLSFKVSVEKISQQKYDLWISIYANGTYIGKVQIVLQVSS